MRKACAIFICAIALAVPSTPSLARTANAGSNAEAAAPKANEPSATAGCRSYVQTPDGEWKPMPCQEVGAEAPASHKRASGKADTATH